MAKTLELTNIDDFLDYLISLFEDENIPVEELDYGIRVQYSLDTWLIQAKAFVYDKTNNVSTAKIHLMHKNTYKTKSCGSNCGMPDMHTQFNKRMTAEHVVKYIKGHAHKYKRKRRR